MSRRVEVVAPSRLHFGLWALEADEGTSYGGLGLMIDQPGLRLTLTPAARCAATGPLAARAVAILEQLAPSFPQLPACRAVILSAPPEHVGLGTGTQLALALAAGWQALAGGPRLDALGLARLTGRGQRSAIGTHGFLHGGLLADAGKQPGQPIAPLLARAALPESWSIVLAVPAASPGLSGAAEQEALGRLGPLPAATTAELCRLALDELLPAALAVDFARFSQALFAYGQLAGSCFAASQGGAFRGDCVAPLVDLLRSWGVVGVGQSSWGPAIFALQPDLTHGQLLRERLRPEVRGGQVWLARPHNAGAPCTIADA